METYTNNYSRASDKTDNKVISLLKNVVNTLGTLIVVNIQLLNASGKLSRSVKRDHKRFLLAGTEEKEAILLKWERLAKKLSDHSKNTAGDRTSVLSRGMVKKSARIMSTVDDFVVTLKARV